MKTQDAPFCRACKIWRTVHNSGLCQRCREDAVESESIYNGEPRRELLEFMQAATGLGVPYGKPGRFARLEPQVPDYSTVFGQPRIGIVIPLGLFAFFPYLQARYEGNLALARRWPDRVAGDFGTGLHGAPASAAGLYKSHEHHRVKPIFILPPLPVEGALTPDIGN